MEYESFHNFKSEGESSSGFPAKKCKTVSRMTRVGSSAHYYQEQTSVTSGEEEESEVETSSNTINKYNEIFRTLICDKMLQEGNNKIGGENKIVEVDESLFGKRKGSIKKKN